MKLSLSRALLFVGIPLLFLGPVGVAHAHGLGYGHEEGHQRSHGEGLGYKKHAPEIDPTSLGSGLVLLVGSGLLLLEKYRHRL
jgi:hypothetical protein